MISLFISDNSIGNRRGVLTQILGVHTPRIIPKDYTLSGHIGKVVASNAAVARSIPAEVALIYTMHVTLRGYCP